MADASLFKNLAPLKCGTLLQSEWKPMTSNDEKCKIINVWKRIIAFWNNHRGVKIWWSGKDIIEAKIVWILGISAAAQRDV